LTFLGCIARGSGDHRSPGGFIFRSSHRAGAKIAGTVRPSMNFNRWPDRFARAGDPANVKRSGRGFSFDPVIRTRNGRPDGKPTFLPQ
jgi:hypothetical protein